MIEAASVGGLFRISATGFDRLAQSLHGELDGSRREVAPDLDLGLELLLRISLEIFPYCPPGGRALPCEFLADKRVYGHQGLCRIVQAQPMAALSPATVADK